MNSIKIGVAYDHVLIRNGIARVLKDLGFEISFQCGNETELFEMLQQGRPDIIFVIVNIQTSDNFHTIQELSSQYPDVGVVALSMQDDDKAIIRMLAGGVKGYILKDSDLPELKHVIECIGHKGIHYKEPDFTRLIKYIKEHNLKKGRLDDDLLTNKEIEFLKYLATELTYKEIAIKMFVSPRTIESFRNTLCEKLDIKTRIGLVLYAIQKGIVSIN